jgi:hypothetical protein
MFQSGCSDFIADFLHYRQPKNMRRGFSASLLKRRSVDAARLLDSPDDLSLRGKLINPRPVHSDGIELRGRQHHWISVELPISGK